MPARETAADRLYREQMGAAAFERQKEAFKDERSCTCGLGFTMKGKYHPPGCGANPQGRKR